MQLTLDFRQESPKAVLKHSLKVGDKVTIGIPIAWSITLERDAYCQMMTVSILEIVGNNAIVETLSEWEEACKRASKDCSPVNYAGNKWKVELKYLRKQFF